MPDHFPDFEEFEEFEELLRRSEIPRDDRQRSRDRQLKASTIKALRRGRLLLARYPALVRAASAVNTRPRQRREATPRTRGSRRCSSGTSPPDSDPDLPDDLDAHPALARGSG